jgi:serine protease AprX
VPILMVFPGPGDRDRAAALVEEVGGRVLEWYERYAVAEVPDDAARRRLQDAHPVEDVTSLYGIRGSDRQLDTFRPRIDREGKLLPHPDYADEPSLPEGPHHYLVQFLGPIKQEWLAGVTDAGGELRAPHGHFTEVVRAEPAALQRIARLDYVRWLGHLPYHDHIEPSARASAAAPAGSIKAPQLSDVYTVDFYCPIDLAAARDAVEQLGFEVVVAKPGPGVLVVRTKPGSGRARLKELAAVHGVRQVRPRFLGQLNNNQVGRWMGIGTTGATSEPHPGLDGADQVIAICDTGLDTGNRGPMHPDFAGRVVRIIPHPVSSELVTLGMVKMSARQAAYRWDGADRVNGHGTHVAGSVLGDGTASRKLKSGPIRGLAPAATLVFQAIGRKVGWSDPNIKQRWAMSGLPLDDLRAVFEEAFELGARIHCNAWSFGSPGAYDNEQSAALDRFVWEKKDFCVIVAAGNFDPGLGQDGRPRSKKVMPPGTAKNCITVGMSGTSRWFCRGRGPDQVEDHSRRGPIEGRYKPDVVAPGFRVLSVRSSKLSAKWNGLHRFGRSRNYFYLGGTSQSAALVTGVVALLRQHLMQQGFASPPAALVKAALIAGATRLPSGEGNGAVVDGDQGYGRVNLDAVVRPGGAGIQFEHVTPGLSTKGSCCWHVQVRSPNVPLRVVLAYSDYPGEWLVNNLNLIVVPPAGPGSELYGNQAGSQLDLDNNVEVVDVEHPDPGRWRIEVRAALVHEGPQDFALVYRCDM